MFLDKARLDFNPARAFEKVILETTGFSTPYRLLSGQTEVPSVCLRLPTGGGKTILGAASVGVAAESYCDTISPLVLWLVPSITIVAQTRKALADPHHPYRLALGERFEGRVRVFDIADFENIRPQDLAQNCCVVIATMQTLSVETGTGDECMLTTKILSLTSQPPPDRSQDYKLSTRANRAQAQLAFHSQTC